MRRKEFEAKYGWTGILFPVVLILVMLLSPLFLGCARAGFAEGEQPPLEAGQVLLDVKTGDVEGLRAYLKTTGVTPWQTIATMAVMEEAEDGTQQPVNMVIVANQHGAWKLIALLHDKTVVVLHEGGMFESIPWPSTGG